ncbi:MAG: tetratricopeptide repeat protein, partial [Alkaliphilus sp.]|nr:tetratricopeptide repeat protein [Alkaliphilus sp.]
MIRKIKVVMSFLILIGALLLAGCSSETAESWHYKGMALFQEGKYTEAIECFDKAIAIDPNYTSVWNTKGWALKELERYSEAIECFDKAISLDPNLIAPWNGKGLALANQGKYS